MNLAEEFKKLNEGQEQILQSIRKVEKSKNERQKVYTLDELAKFFSVTKRTIYNWMEQGRFSFTVVGSKTYVTGDQLDQFLAKNEVKSIKLRRN